ncbi:MAG: ATP-dependent 6-phosphofructokinase [Deltaproteobacteria bacterium]|nr:ATP-dependent 6-phosphofructokinase [Deltaproteobacteria bacterium]MBW2306178.1 ATP-dependent 6-phosphofructokinase [Deltaproteobacteria bacterium]
MGKEPDFSITDLGKCTVQSPYHCVTFVTPDEKIIYNPNLKDILKHRQKKETPPAMEVAGPRRTIYFDPSKVRAGIVTCGGLCPGMNSVIRTLVMELWYQYGVQNILGFRYGFEGLVPRYHHKPMILTPDLVANIFEQGGSILGSSRGHQEIGEMVDALERMNICMLFTIGGDGTMRATTLIAEEAMRRGLKLSVIGLPKTIDNDLMYVERSFGFQTAFSVAVQSIKAAHTEALGAHNGIGLVKLMGRHSGYIAANAALALPHVNFVLIPEVPFHLNGERGLLRTLEIRLERRRHAAIVVAEGAGQDLLIKDSDKVERDASGNIKLMDIGAFLRDKITEYFKRKNKEINLKYIDPSYLIRSVPADADDNVFCSVLAQNAVHAAMCGKTNMLVGRWNNIYTHVPIKLTVSQRKTIDPGGNLWGQVLAATGQPHSFINP